MRANVGDRYVLEKMVEHSWTLGGENSGHIIIADKIRRVMVLLHH